MQDVLPIIFRLCDPEELANYNDMTPTTLDYSSDYADGVDRMPFQIRRVENGTGRAATAKPAILDVGPAAAVGRGKARGTGTQSFLSYPTNVSAYDSSRLAGTSKQYRPRGSYKLMEMLVNDGGVAGGRRLPRVGDNVVFVRFKACLLYTSPSPRDLSTSRMPSSA